MVPVVSEIRHVIVRRPCNCEEASERYAELLLSKHTNEDHEKLRDNSTTDTEPINCKYFPNVPKSDLGIPGQCLQADAVYNYNTAVSSKGKVPTLR